MPKTRTNAKIVSLLLVVAAGALLLLLASCERGTPSSDFRVALITPGAITDDGWNEYAYEGLQQIETKLAARIRHFQTRSPAEFDSTLRGFAAEGFDLVIAHGHEYSDAARKIGAEFPDTDFVVTAGTAVASNVSSIQFAIGDAAHLAGMLAAMLSKSGKLGGVGGHDIEPVKDAFDAFRRGALEVNPDSQVVLSWVGSWEDAAAANQAARALISQGADVLFHDADAAGFGVFNAAEEAGLLAIGCNKDQNDIKPKTVVASVVLEIPRAFEAIAREVHEGKHAGAIRRFGIAEGFVHLVINRALDDKVSEVMRKKIEARAAELEQGRKP